MMISMIDKKFFTSSILPGLKAIIVLMVFILAFLALYTVFIKNLIGNLENNVSNLRYQIAENYGFLDNVDSHISSIIFDHYTLEFISTNNIDQIKRWPPPRSAWAKLNNYLTRGNSQAIVYNIFFKDSSESKEDKILSKSIHRSNNLYLASIGIPITSLSKELDFVFKVTNTEKHNINNMEELDDLLKSFKQNIPLDNQAKLSQSGLNQYEHTVKILPTKFDPAFFTNISLAGIQFPYKEFLKSPARIGLINVSNMPTARDLVLRKALLMARTTDHNFIFSLPFEIAFDLNPDNQQTLELKANKLVWNDKIISLNTYGEYNINWRSSSSYRNDPFIGAYLFEKYYTLDFLYGYKVLPEEQNYFAQVEYSYVQAIVDNIVAYNIIYINNYNSVYSKNVSTSNRELNKYLYSSGYQWPYNFKYFISILDQYSEQINLPDNYAGNIVFISEGSKIASSINQSMYANDVFVTMLDNLLYDEEFITSSGPITQIMIYFMLVATIFFIIRISKTNYLYLFAFILIYIVYMTINFIIFYKFKIIVPLVNPLFISTIIFIGAVISQNIVTRYQLKKTSEDVITDGLTKLYNRKHFDRIIKDRTSNNRRKEDTISLLLIDIDHFKKINDTYGHQAGDYILQKLSSLIKDNIREVDMGFRYGGEEIAIILENTSPSEALKTAEKLRKIIAGYDFYLSSESNIITVTVSIDVSNFPEDAQNIAELIQIADKYLYVAKDHGRNRVGNKVSSCEKSNIAEREAVYILKDQIISEIKSLKELCHKYNIDYDIIMKQIQDEITKGK
jgi:diguanylate cyclase